MAGEGTVYLLDQAGAALQQAHAVIAQQAARIQELEHDLSRLQGAPHDD